MMIPDYWEPPSTLTPLGNLDLARKGAARRPPAVGSRRPPSFRSRCLARGRSYFTCPNCGTVVRFDNRYPFGWQLEGVPRLSLAVGKDRS